MSKRILVVDDDIFMTAHIRKMLEERGFEADEAFSGAEAQKKIEGSIFDLILLDYSMPNMKGDELCEWLRGEKADKTPVIMITAFQNKDEAEFIDCGATSVMYKPIESEELFEKISEQIDIN